MTTEPIHHEPAATPADLPGIDLDQIQKLIDDDRILRTLSATENAPGQAESDYAHLWDMYVRISQRMKAIDADPTAFLGQHGGYDVAMLRTLKDLTAESRHLLETRSKMINSDRLTRAILEEHARTMVQLVAQPLGEELKAFLSELKTLPGSSDLYTRLAGLLQHRLPVMFREAAGQAILKASEEYNLH